MKMPNVSENYYQERAGVLKVAMELNNYGFIFRETQNGDIGIDSQIEHVNESGEATGMIVAAQIKSGNSYLIDKGDHFAFRQNSHLLFCERTFMVIDFGICQARNGKCRNQTAEALVFPLMAL